MKTALFFLMAFWALFSSAVAGEPMVYTDEDLEKYSRVSTYDEDTVKRLEADTRQWEKKSKIREKLESERAEVEDKPEIESEQKAPDKIAEKMTKPFNSTQGVKKKRT